MAEAPPLTVTELAAIPVERLNGISDSRRVALASCGVTTVLDLLTYYPRRYLDRTREARIRDLAVGEEATLLVDVLKVSSKRSRRGQTIVTIEVGDGSGSLRCTFFNQPWRGRQLSVGQSVIVFGRLDVFRGQRQMANPIVDMIGDRTGRLVPIYPQSEKAGLSTWELGGWISEALRRCEARGIAEVLPDTILARFKLTTRYDALRGIHEPDSMAQVNIARSRLVFDELLRVQLALVERKRVVEATAKGIRHGGASGAEGLLGPESLVGRFWAGLPYALTGAQRRVVREIATDLALASPMHRLLQGDVGSGKTVVALSALLAGVESGFQGALMAPTEVLAEQHHLGIRRLVASLEVPDVETLSGSRPVRVELLTHRTTAAERRRLNADLLAGRVDVMVGTHALIQGAVTFGRLGVVVIDEQHRFGVEQRAALREKTTPSGEQPDVLVMTATPIPRTAAMTVYGDLDVSVLDELPPGRRPIHTQWVTEETLVWEHVRAEIAQGHQAYVVTPLIEESDKIETASAEEVFGRLTDPAGELDRLRVGLLHGRLASADKDGVMERFRLGSIDVLVATTVIEVGVDVPNATIMVILGADRFGIAQLHQLRGRVGRGMHHSTCYLVSAAETPQAEARLSALAATTDGFELAEVDLELRGEGTIMGSRQTGRNDLKLASLRRDRIWVERAREVAFDLLIPDGLAAWPQLETEVDLFLGGSDTEFLLKD